MRAYVPPNIMHAVHQVYQALTAKTMSIETILMVDLNARLEDPFNEREEDLTTALSNHGLENACRHFIPRRRYRGRAAGHERLN